MYAWKQNTKYTPYRRQIAVQNYHENNNTSVNFVQSKQQKKKHARQ